MCSVIQQKFALCLRKLHIQFAPSTLNNPFEDLHSLLKCHRLVDLELKGIGLWKLADSDLRMMATSWSSLASLKFLDSWLRWDIRGPPQLLDVSTLGLLQLANLPRLEVLHLPISRFDVPNTNPAAAITTVSHIRQLTLEIRAPILSPNPLALFISQRFPWLSYGDFDIVSRHPNCYASRLQLLQSFEQCHLEAALEDLCQLFL